MPNWCSTTITFHGENAKKLDDLITEWTKESLPGVGFGETWLGNCLVNSGIMSFDEACYGNVRCRGAIAYHEVTDEEELVVETETAWGPMIEMWSLINHKLGLDLEIVFSATEPGSEIYCTNDPAMEGTYYVDVFLGEKDAGDDCFELHEYSISKEDVDRLFAELKYTFPKAKDFNDIHKYLKDPDSYVSFYKWDYVYIGEMD